MKIIIKIIKMIKQFFDKFTKIFKPERKRNSFISLNNKRRIAQSMTARLKNVHRQKAEKLMTRYGF